MANLLRRIFGCRAYVYRGWNGTHVRGDDFDIASMMVACVLALEKIGWDVSDLKYEIKTLKKMEENNK